MRKIIFFLFLLFDFFSCHSSISGEGIATIQKEFTVKRIENLNISCNCKVILVEGDKTNLKLDTHQNLIDNLEIATNNNSLSIKEDKEVNDFSSYDVYVFITNELKKIIIDKKVSLKVSGTLSLDKLEIIASDSSKIDQSYLVVDELRLKSKDQSCVTLEGHSKKIRINAKGESNLDLFKFKVNDADFFVENNTRLELNVGEVLLGTASGNSFVSFSGSPNKELKILEKAIVLKN